MKKEALAQVLTYGGLLPFFGAMMMSIVQPGLLSLNYQQVFLTYGAVIASFVAGIHWGVYLFRDTKLNLFIHSNIVAILAWVAAALAIPSSAGILIVCFAYLLLIDKQLASAGVLEVWYVRLRTVASILVILMLAISIVLQK